MREDRRRIAKALVAASLALGACSNGSSGSSSSSSSSTTTGGGGGTTGAQAGFALVVLSPTPGSPVPAAADAQWSVAIDYALAVTLDGGVVSYPDGGVDQGGIPFELRGLGSCNGRAHCGHVVLNVSDDAGSTCNQPGQTYNNTAAYGPIDAQMALCCSPDGVHTFSLSVADDQGSPIQEGGTSLTASVSADVTAPAGSSQPPEPCQCRDGGADSCAVDGGTGLDGGVEDGGVPDAGGLDGGGVADAGPPGDAGVSDAGQADAGPLDAGTPDAGVADAGQADAGPADAGSLDAGVPDAGQLDAGPSDAGSADAGSSADGGESLDGGADGG